MSFVLWLFEIGYILQHIATLSQAQTILKKKKTELISIETNVMFLIGAISRLVWMWDSMLKSFWLSYVETVLGLGSLGLIFYFFRTYKNSLNNLDDSSNKLPIYFRLQILIPIVAILAFFFHPGSKNSYYMSMQMFVSLSIFSESIGLIPQLWMIKHEKETGSLSKYYVLFLAVARFFRLLFWLQMYFEGNKFISLIIADLVHCILISDFVYNVVKNWDKLALPLTGESIEKPKKMF
jgi:ER lumen protein retaining receptor